MKYVALALSLVAFSAQASDFLHVVTPPKTKTVIVEKNDNSTRDALLGGVIAYLIVKAVRHHKHHKQAACVEREREERQLKSCLAK